MYSPITQSNYVQYTLCALKHFIPFEGLDQAGKTTALYFLKYGEIQMSSGSTISEYVCTQLSIIIG